MTKEEVIKWFRESPFYHKNHEPFNMAIKALEQADVLDKIRAEIVGLTYYWCEVNPNNIKADVLEIIDKYKAESEGV